MKILQYFRSLLSISHFLKKRHILTVYESILYFVASFCTKTWVIGQLINHFWRRKIFAEPTQRRNIISCSYFSFFGFSHPKKKSRNYSYSVHIQIQRFQTDPDSDPTNGSRSKQIRIPTFFPDLVFRTDPMDPRNRQFLYFLLSSLHMLM